MSYTFSIPVEPPYPWESILRYLTYRSTPGLETVAADRYVRQTGGGVVSVAFDPSGQALRCTVECPADRAPEPGNVLMRVERLFDTRHSPRPVDRLLRRCPILRPRLRKLGGVRAPGCWDPFELCLRVILGQQVSVRAAHTLMGRLVARCPELTPGQVAAADISTLGMPARRLQTIQLFAQKVLTNDIRFNRPWDEVVSQLAEVPGFGPWTLQYLAIRLGRDQDAFPAQDLGLLHATGAKTPRQLQKLAEAWRPYRAYAAMYLWIVDLLPA